MNGQLSLVLETSTPHGSLATIMADQPIQQREFTSDRNHNAGLFGPLEELLRSHAVASVGLILVGSGPGSYSGTRVGIAAAQGVAIASNCPAVAVPSILAVPSAKMGARCIAVGDARRGSYWTATMEHSHLTQPPELTDASGLAAVVAQAIADGVSVISFEAPTQWSMTPELKSQILQEIPTAERLWQAWIAAPQAARDEWLQSSPQPIYLKPPHITPAKRSWLIQGSAGA